jgi:hypothetical protein
MNALPLRVAVAPAQASAQWRPGGGTRAKLVPGPRRGDAGPRHGPRVPIWEGAIPTNPHPRRVSAATAARPSRREFYG